MSIAQWVIDTYLNGERNEVVKLEAAKNFTFIWCLFEHIAGKDIFSSEGLKVDEFFNWISSLEIRGEFDGVVIVNPKNNCMIDGELVNYINNAFEHFYNMYKKDEDKFIEQLYREDIPMVRKEKDKFKTFSMGLDNNDIRNKIYFLFFVSKRMRNNFFHGIKKTYQVSQDSEEFKKSGEYLIAIMSLLDDAIDIP